MTTLAREVPAARYTLGPVRLAALCLFAALPVVVVVMTFVVAIGEDSAALDFGQFHGAAEDILRGDDPYAPSTEYGTPWGSPYPYPPPGALLAIPLSWLPLGVAELLVMSLLVVVALAIPFVLGVRDWRCFGLALLWPPVISAIQTGNLTLPLALGAAAVWRLRDRRPWASVLVGTTLAVKLFLWPIAVWLAATRRVATALSSVTIGVACLLLSWAVIGFAGLAEYPALLQRLDDAVGRDAYTLYVLGLDLGLPSQAARALWLAAGIGLLVAVVVVGRRGAERVAFTIALGAALALTPIVWLHYFALLLVVVAVASPRLGAAWFAPLLLVFVPGGARPTSFELVWALSVVSLTFLLSLRAVRSGTVPSETALVPAT